MTAGNPRDSSSGCVFVLECAEEDAVDPQRRKMIEDSCLKGCSSKAGSIFPGSLA